MTVILETSTPLTEDERREVQTFAEFLIARRTAAAGKPDLSGRGKSIDLDAVAGMFAGLAPDKTSVELQHEALEARAAED